MSLSVYNAIERLESVIASLESVRRQLTDSEQWSGQLGADVAKALVAAETQLARIRNDVLVTSKPWSRNK